MAASKQRDSLGRSVYPQRGIRGGALLLLQDHSRRNGVNERGGRNEL